MFTSRWSSYLFQTTRLFPTIAYENTAFEESNQKWLGSRDSRTPLHLWQTESFFRMAGGGRWWWQRQRWQLRFRKGPVSTANPCYVKFTITGAHV